MEAVRRFIFPAAFTRIPRGGGGIWNKPQPSWVPWGLQLGATARRGCRCAVRKGFVSAECPMLTLAPGRDRDRDRGVQATVHGCSRRSTHTHTHIPPPTPRPASKRR